MKGERNNSAKKPCLGLALCCLLTSSALANIIDVVKYDTRLPDNNRSNETYNESIYSHKKVYETTPEVVVVHKKNYVSPYFIEKDGKLFFEMRKEQILISESSAIALLLLGFIGLFLRRWP